MSPPRSPYFKVDKKYQTAACKDEYLFDRPVALALHMFADTDVRGDSGESDVDHN